MYAFFFHGPVYFQENETVYNKPDTHMEIVLSVSLYESSNLNLSWIPFYIRDACTRMITPSYELSFSEWAGTNSLKTFCYIQSIDILSKGDYWGGCSNDILSWRTYCKRENCIWILWTRNEIWCEIWLRKGICKTNCNH